MVIPLSPEEVVATRDMSRVQSAMLQINEKVAQSLRDYPDHIWVIIPDTLNMSERKYIEEEYLKAGWLRVTHISSRENGERPGLLSFRMYFLQ